MRLLIAGLLVLPLLAGCATSSVTLPPTEDVILPAPAQQVRDALVAVLEDDGYPVKDIGDARMVKTGYRSETAGPWDWLVIWRFGISRSRVEGTVSAETDDRTLLSIAVIYEAKRHIWSAWREAPVPPHRDPDVHVQAVKRMLGLV